MLDLNKVVDSVLRTVYEAARKITNTDSQKRSRRIIFTGFDATVCQHSPTLTRYRGLLETHIHTQLCTHIQLKQPNFAVFFSSYCNVKRSAESSIQQAADIEQSLSVRESVKLAKSQNMLGLALDCRILVSPFSFWTALAEI